MEAMSDRVRKATQQVSGAKGPPARKVVTEGSEKAWPSAAARRAVIMPGRPPRGPVLRSCRVLQWGEAQAQAHAEKPLPRSGP